MGTIVITLTDDTWDEDVGDDNEITDALIAGIDSDGVEVGGWDAVVRANMVFGDVTRLNDTTVQIILGDEPDYAIDADETITITIPDDALAGGEETVATPTFDITAEDPSDTRRVISSPRYGITRMARR